MHALSIERMIPPRSGVARFVDTPCAALKTDLGLGQGTIGADV
jgi:hypothetical protein